MKNCYKGMGVFCAVIQYPVHIVETVQQKCIVPPKIFECVLNQFVDLFFGRATKAERHVEVTLPSPLSLSLLGLGDTPTRKIHQSTNGRGVDADKRPHSSRSAVSLSIFLVQSFVTSENDVNLLNRLVITFQPFTLVWQLC